MLVKMLEWYIGINTDFSISAGKLGKYFKKYLSPEFYEMYENTYSDSNYNNFWTAIAHACDLFRILAKIVSQHFGYTYNQCEDANMTKYLNKVKDNYFNAEL